MPLYWRNLPDDALSLTLPKASGRSVRRRWQKPPKEFWIALALMMAAIVIALWASLNGDYGLMASESWTAVFLWKIALSVKENRPLHPFWTSSEIVNIIIFIVVINIG